MEQGAIGPEQKTTEPLTKDPLAVFDQMEQARKSGDVPRFLQHVGALDQMFLPGSEEFPTGIRATEVPGISRHLKLLGKTPAIWRGAYDNLEAAVREDNPAVILQKARLVELLSIPDTAPRVGDYISELREKYGTAELKEPETKEVEITWDDLLGMNYHLCLRPGLPNNPLNPEASDYFHDKSLYLSERQLKDYLKDHPVQTLQNSLSGSYWKAGDVRSSLTAEQVKHHLQENLLDLLRLDPRIIREDAFIRSQTITSSGERVEQPDIIRDTVKQMLTNLSPDLIKAELRKNPLLTLQTGEGMLDTSTDLGWGRKKPEIQLSSKISKLIIEAMEKLTPEQVRTHLRANPLDILRVVPANLTYLKPETLTALRHEAGKLRFRMQGEVDSDINIALTEEQSAPPEKPPMPEIPVYYRSWQEEFGQGEYLDEGLSGKVFRPEAFPEIVVKEDKGTKYGDAFEQELHALRNLQGIPGVAQLKGYNARTGLPYPRYLVKEYVDGENLESTIIDASGMPIRAGEKTSPEQKKAARWLVSSLEALAEIHARGLLVGDFRVSDFPWDAKNQRSVCIDLGNALDTDPSSKFYPMSKSFTIDRFKEINHFLHIFLAETKLGQTMKIMPNNIEERLDYLDVIGSNILLIQANNSNATNSFLNIILMIKEEGSGKKHSAQEYADTLKDHFKEVGLWEQIQSQPTIVISPAEAEDREPLTPPPERQALEQTAAQQAAALAQQTGTPFTEQNWTEYERWKKEQEKQG